MTFHYAFIMTCDKKDKLQDLPFFSSTPRKEIAVKDVQIIS